jgi:hypothetical protein
MLAWLTKLLAGPLVDKIMSVIGLMRDQSVTEAQIRAEVEKQVLGTIEDVTRTQGDVIMAEMRGRARSSASGGRSRPFCLSGSSSGSASFSRFWWAGLAFRRCAWGTPCCFKSSSW